ncbi:succinate dehydrogenase cytochrome b560 subunit, mitochondrial-like [Ruditapes philippinarum]|uniref:succinate dehydrogenase cytochrome b560 subunit, mitochondrial-like n=1 Tax=Ruditapes philippinarum TaxID=129788 RepID=UPI00295B804B|nr:succinate dehydrogenase cytochrome b560 subunit, mitochondrial-like [Ruditapes philippinarum]
MAAVLLRNMGRQALATKNQGVFCMIKSCGPMSTMQAYQQMEEFWKKNRKLNRPLSPHLRIYKPELPMMTSLAHRVTGIAMALTVSGASIFLFLAPGDYAHWLGLLQSLELGPALIIGLKYLIALPVCFHYINGIRHLAWDWAWGFGLQKLYKTGYFAITLTFLVATVFVFGFPLGGKKLEAQEKN